MENYREYLLNEIVPLKRGVGLRTNIEGWMPDEWDSGEEFAKEAFDQDSEKPEFDSLQEMEDFVRARGQYEDANSFFITYQDFEETAVEGFFQPLQCHKCLEEITDRSIDDDLDPELSVTLRGPYELRSYRPEMKKKGVSRWYNCSNDHYNVFLAREWTWYEDA